MNQINIPLCECGCGKKTTWNKRKKKWNKRLVGHHERTPEMRKKLSDSQKESSFFHTYNKTKEHSKNVIQSNQNRIVSQETKRKIAKALTGHERSESTKLKTRITMIDNNSTRSENNGNWKNGNSNYKDTGEWVKLSREIKKRDNYTCQKCGSKTNIVVHHIDFEKHNHEPLNLTALCKKCHFKIHRKHNKEIT